MERRAGKTVSVSWSPTQGQYRKYVGYQLGRSGKPQPKCWYLGEDEREAVRRAVELVAEWNRLKAAGATVWPLKAASGDASENKRAKDDFVDANALTVGEVCALNLDSCPNSCPLVFWADGNFEPLFPRRTNAPSASSLGFTVETEF
ncbi:MAG: hypothetical protein KF864_11580 [Phycisphaeraceae bacterium]|nr:hypothetical protein [Phycisphaeraceae bacterium]